MTNTNTNMSMEAQMMHLSNSITLHDAPWYNNNDGKIHLTVSLDRTFKSVIEYKLYLLGYTSSSANITEEGNLLRIKVDILNKKAITIDEQLAEISSIIDSTLVNYVKENNRFVYKLYDSSKKQSLIDALRLLGYKIQIEFKQEQSMMAVESETQNTVLKSTYIVMTIEPKKI